MATKVNLNRATVDDLINNIQGIGRKTAEKIVSYRNQNGGKIRNIDDLRNISDIDATMEKKIRQKAEV